MDKKIQIRALKRIEIAILFYTVCDYSTDEVAGTLKMASSTVNYHLTKIYKKLGIEGQGRVKRENLIVGYQEVVFDIVNSPEVLESWIRKVSPFYPHQSSFSSPKPSYSLKYGLRTADYLGYQRMIYDIVDAFLNSSTS
jgi:DNA-binding CsgD family transcriptional regulator